MDTLEKLKEKLVLDCNSLNALTGLLRTQFPRESDVLTSVERDILALLELLGTGEMRWRKVTTSKTKRILMRISDVLKEDIVCDDGVYTLKPSERDLLLAKEIDAIIDELKEFEIVAN